MNFSADRMIIDPPIYIEFPVDQHDIWMKLYACQAPQNHKYACDDYLERAFILKLPTDRNPAIRWLN